MASMGEIDPSNGVRSQSSSASLAAAGRRLDSWKAIAQYLGRDVRSVQRWEQHRRLPVHRVPGQKGGTVFAYEHELDHWLSSGRIEETASSTKQTSESAAEPPDFEMGASRQAVAASASSRAKIGLFSVLFIIIVISAVLAIGLKFRSNPAPGDIQSIAVLPLQNLSGDASQEYLADGFTEELVTELAQVHSLRIISRTSTMVYKASKKPLPQIAGELHVKYILEGSIARDGQHVRVTAQLINAATDTHLWARSYEAELKDIFGIQGQISRAIADDVQVRLFPDEQDRLAHAPSVDPEAHDLYLKAEYQFGEQTPASIRQSLALYKAAVAKDPSFAPAYVGIALAETALLQITAEAPDESFRGEQEALNQAVAINPHLGEARGMLASLAYSRDWDWPRAEREFRLALAAGAGAPTEQRYGSYLVSRGRFEEGMAHLRNALELDPLGRSPRVNQFFGFYFQRRYAEARQQLNEILSSSPDFLAGHLLLGLVSYVQHDCAEASAQAEWAEKRFPAPVAQFELALAAACTGNVNAARRHLEIAANAKSGTFASPYQIALGYAAIHDKEMAISYLEKSADSREPQILYLLEEPIFDEIRTDSRYVVLEKRVGLSPTP
jgi:TolB-like protein/Tfp pilus assembly protein PilF